MAVVMDNALKDRINRYLDDAIALESGGLAGLKDMVSEATDPQDAAMFQQHVAETEQQKARLEALLHARGGTSNKLKDVMNKIGIAATDLLHAGKDAGDKATRNLIEAYSIESLEVATYESLYAAAMEVGDAEVAQAAKDIQAQEQAMAERLFARVAPVAREAIVRAANH